MNHFQQNFEFVAPWPFVKRKTMKFPPSKGKYFLNDRLGYKPIDIHVDPSDKHGKSSLV